VIVLLDENLPHDLRHSFPDHNVSTVFYRGWSGRKNGGLIALCEENAIDVMVTADQGIAHQQNMKDRRLALVVLPTNDPAVLQPMIATIVQAIDRARPGSCQFVP
jgi:hypothetical protein